MTNFNAYKLTTVQDRQVKEEIIRIVKEQAPITVRGIYYLCVLSEKLPFLSKDSGGSKRNYVLVQAGSNICGRLVLFPLMLLLILVTQRVHAIAGQVQSSLLRMLR